MLSSSTRTGAAIVSAAVALAGTGTAASASAATATDDCTQGSAQQAVEAGIVAANHVRRGRTHTGIADAYLTCVYTLYKGGATYTFSEEDTFAGMTAFQGGTGRRTAIRASRSTTSSPAWSTRCCWPRCFPTGPSESSWNSRS